MWLWHTNCPNIFGIVQRWNKSNICFLLQSLLSGSIHWGKPMMGAYDVGAGGCCAQSNSIIGPVGEGGGDDDKIINTDLLDLSINHNRSQQWWSWFYIESTMSALTSNIIGRRKLFKNSWAPKRAPILGRGHLRELINQNATNLVSDPRTIFAICHTEIDWGLATQSIWDAKGSLREDICTNAFSRLSYVSTKLHYSTNGSWTIVAISILPSYYCGKPLRVESHRHHHFLTGHQSNCMCIQEKKYNFPVLRGKK